jgi:hypothetical protein
VLDRSPRVAQLKALGASLHRGRPLGAGAPGIAAGGTVQRKLMVAHGSGSESVEEWDTAPKAAGVRGFLAPDQDAVDRMDASRKAFPPPKAAGDGKKVPKWEARGREMNADAPRETANADGTKAVPAAEVVLGHELVHADRAQRGRTAEGEFSSHHVGGVKHFAPQEELETVGLVPKTHPHDITENDLRAQMKTPLRESYNFGEAARKYTAKANQPKVDAFNAELARLQKATREKAAAQAAAAPAASTPASAKGGARKPASKK